MSRVLPSYERSDHASFANKGILAAQLLGSNQDGIFLDYHQKQTLNTMVQHIEKLLPILKQWLLHHLGRSVVEIGFIIP